jgi:hypothetical protein
VQPGSDRLGDRTEPPALPKALAGLESGGSVADVTFEPYTGKYSQDRRLLEYLEMLRRDIPSLVREAGTAFHLEQSAPPSIRIRLRDANAVPFEYDLIVTTENEGGKGVQVLSLTTETLVVGAYDLRTSLLHELVHCWQWSVCGRAISDCPRLYREGLASWASGTGEDSIRRFCSQSCSSEETLSAILGEEHEKVKAGTIVGDGGMAYSYMFVQLLYGKCRDRGKANALDDLFRGPDWKAYSQEVAGVSVADVMTELGSFATERISRLLENRNEYLVAKRRYKNGEYEKAQVDYERFLEAHPGDVLGPRAMYELMICRFMTRDFFGSERVGRESRLRWPFSELHAGIAKYNFLSAFERGDAKQTEELGQRFLRDYSYLSGDTLSVIRGKLDECRKWPDQSGR